jgi:hypothetical protein
MARKTIRCSHETPIHLGGEFTWLDLKLRWKTRPGRVEIYKPTLCAITELHKYYFIHGTQKDEGSDRFKWMMGHLEKTRKRVLKNGYDVDALPWEYTPDTKCPEWCWRNPDIYTHKEGIDLAEAENMLRYCLRS